MRQNACLVLLALALSSCATTRSQYGNLVESAVLDQEMLATDAAQQLATLHAPARTRLELRQPATDPFGQALVRTLRNKGFALLELAPTKTSAQAVAAASAAACAAATASKPAVKPLSDTSSATVLSGATAGTMVSVALPPFLKPSTSSAVKPTRATQPTCEQNVKG